MTTGVQGVGHFALCVVPYQDAGARKMKEEPEKGQATTHTPQPNPPLRNCSMSNLTILAILCCLTESNRRV